MQLALLSHGDTNIVLCQARIDQLPLSGMKGALTAAEWNKAQRYSIVRQAEQSLAARGLLRLMLSHYTGTPPQELRIIEPETAAPYLAHPEARLHFSVSHSLDRLLVAVSSDPVGVDIEWKTPQLDWQIITTLLLHPLEREFIEKKPASERSGAFHRIWTRKEALLKASGEGLSRELSTFSVVEDRGMQMASSVTLNRQTWQLAKIGTPASYRASLATARKEASFQTLPLSLLMQSS